eukprot:TRINITY_DN9247_c0_g2_i1.p1 TRINITY_DN9247_c0_g2~~TRINITY_DN9247_c0_g2_i1.p1  ORF type:complete len:947 (+),score=217.66 TRINITY_DN9247_c0_g2_i1:400-2841(+)
MDGRAISALNPGSIQDACDQFRAACITQIAVSGIFSSVDDSQEQATLELIRKHYPEAQVTLSSSIGRLGLLERESATILNASLQPLATRTIAGFQQALHALQLKCALFLTQNDGTLISAAEAVRFPILTFGSGPTNSMRGAAFLAKQQDAIVIDVGGTTTDVGALVNGFPRERAFGTRVAGVRTNFRMPDVLSFGLGGGSIVSDDGGQVGPLSVGYKLQYESRVFGGQVLTATDIAVAAGQTGIGDPSLVSSIPQAVILSAQRGMVDMVAEAVDKFKLSADPVPAIVVGGGSILIGDTIAGCSSVIRPPHFSVANACGAAIAQVSGTADGIVRAGNREAELKTLTDQAVENAVRAGADRVTVKVVDVDEAPLAYTKDPSSRVRVKAVGDLSETIHALELFDSASSAFAVEQVSSSDIVAVGETAAAKRNYVPKVVDGVWHITEDDIDCIGLGAAVLGSGGGGATYLATIKCKTLLAQGRQMRIVSVNSLKDGEGAVMVAGLGAPTVSSEKPMNGRETVAVIKALMPLSRDKIAGLISAEIGGANSLEPLASACQLDLPVIDCDGMGRALPEVQMVSFFINGCPQVPCALADDRANTVIVSEIPSDADKPLEAIVRTMCVQWGGACGIACAPVPARDLRSFGVHNTFSIAHRLGAAILQSRDEKRNPITTLLQVTGGEAVIQGKIVSVVRQTAGGFARGVITVEALRSADVPSDAAPKRLCIDFHNENVFISTADGQVFHSVPNIITMLETDTAEPILCEDLRYGQRVTVVVLPCHPMMCSSKALGVVGPAAFGRPEVVYAPVATWHHQRSYCE